MLVEVSRDEDVGRALAAASAAMAPITSSRACCSTGSLSWKRRKTLPICQSAVWMKRIVLSGIAGEGGPLTARKQLHACPADGAEPAMRQSG